MSRLLKQALKKVGLKRKKTFHADEPLKEEVQQLRQNYQKIVWELDPDQMISLDGSGIHHGMTRLFGRALSEERAHGSCPKNRGKNITMISAICPEQVLAAMTYEGGTEYPRLYDLYYQNACTSVMGWCNSLDG